MNYSRNRSMTLLEYTTRDLIIGGGAKVGWLILFNDTLAQLGYVVSCITILFLNLQITDG